MPEFDPRLTLARDGLAADWLEGVVAAERYVRPAAMQAAVPSAAVRTAPDAHAEQHDQLLFGERFDVLEEKGGWALGQARRDGYVGYVEAASLAAPPLAPTHTVRALRTYAFARPDIKAAHAGLYSINALITVEERRGRFVKAARAGWFIEDHLVPVGAATCDPAAVAEGFLGAPYHWGGRESLGLDCSGLVQQALYACGHACPRDSDQQEAMGTAVARADLRRGDLVFWDGHVAMMTGPDAIIHANSHHMAVATEPLADAIARVGEPRALRRI